MEPVNKKSLDRELTPKFDESENSDNEEEVSDISDIDSLDVGSDSVAELDEKPRFGRRRRRATSSGVVSGE